MDLDVLPTPQTTLVILLGASTWPRWQELEASEAFVNSALGFKNYLLDPHAYALPQENLLDLFDIDQSADDIDEAIHHFLKTRLDEMQRHGQVARDILLYFTGHAGFIGESMDYYLAIRRTRKSNPEVSGLRMLSLARTIKEHTRHFRRFLILDCCYAASAFGAFQNGSLEEVAIVQTTDAFRGLPPPVETQRRHVPKKGTTLLCSSSRSKPSLMGTRYTEFSGALLYVLQTGSVRESQPLSLHMLGHLIRDYLDKNGSDAPRPEVHSPDQGEGDIADISFFPNPHVIKQLITRPSKATDSREQSKTINVFYSYAPEDAASARELQKHLILLQRSGYIQNWHPGETVLGQEPNEQIKQQLQNAQIILLLVSPDFIFSKDKSIEDNIELEMAMKRKDEGAIVIPIYLRHIDWAYTPFRQLVILPRNRKPLSDWNNKDKAFMEIAMEIRNIVDTLRSQQMNMK